MAWLWPNLSPALINSANWYDFHLALPVPDPTPVALNVRPSPDAGLLPIS